MRLDDLDLPLSLPTFSGSEAGLEEWEVEIGFGKGRYLLEQAALHQDVGYLGIEVASKYYRLVRDRACRRGLENLVLLRGEALYLLSAVLPQGFARRVHVYFPDPWPKARHQARRLFDPESVDLILRLLRPGGSLSFATDYLEYGHAVRELLEGHPALATEELPDLWDGGPRTNYEAKYEREGRPILRLEARLLEAEELLHPQGELSILSGLVAPGSPEVA